MGLSDAVEGPLFGVAASHSSNAYCHIACYLGSSFRQTVVVVFSFVQIFSIEVVHAEKRGCIKLLYIQDSVSYKYMLSLSDCRYQTVSAIMN